VNRNVPAAEEAARAAAALVEATRRELEAVVRFEWLLLQFLQTVTAYVDTKDRSAGDQGMMFGYAVNETDVLMPLPIHLSHVLLNNIRKLREDRVLEWLRPDSKSQVTVEYEGNKAVRVDTVVISTQHTPEVTHDQIRAQIIDKLIRPAMPAGMMDDKTIIHVNPTGRFVVGGPHGDAGLTGRKIIVDTYGGRGRHGGGAFSGKDPSKVDRSAAYMARYIAKNVVASGISEECEVQLSYAIGVAAPTSVNVNLFGRGKVSDDVVIGLIREHFPLTPYGLIKHLNLKRPIFAQTATGGHFGRTEADFTWEKTDKADALRKGAKL
jgi:S-adenosylmethionine synthetase